MLHWGAYLKGASPEHWHWFSLGFFRLDSLVSDYFVSNSCFGLIRFGLAQKFVIEIIAAFTFSDKLFIYLVSLVPIVDPLLYSNLCVLIVVIFIGGLINRFYLLIQQNLETRRYRTPSRLVTNQGANSAHNGSPCFHSSSCGHVRT